MFVKFSPPEYWVKRDAEFKEKLTVVGALHRAGVPFLAGTDSGGVPNTYPGFSLHEELAFLVQAGFTPMEALQTATLNPAKFLGLTVHNTQKIRGVLARGRYLDRAALDALLAEAKAAAE